MTAANTRLWHKSRLPASAVVTDTSCPYNLSVMSSATSLPETSPSEVRRRHPALRRLPFAAGADRRALVALLDCAFSFAATGWQGRGAGDFVQGASRAR